MRYKPGCTGKINYISEREAQSVKRNWKTKEKIYVYKCEFKEYGQEHWHVSKMKKKDFRKSLKKTS